MKHAKRKRLIAVLLLLVMLVSTIPAHGLAEGMLPASAPAQDGGLFAVQEDRLAAAQTEESQADDQKEETQTEAAQTEGSEDLQEAALKEREEIPVPEGSAAPENAEAGSYGAQKEESSALTQPALVEDGSAAAETAHTIETEEPGNGEGSEREEETGAPREGQQAPQEEIQADAQEGPSPEETEPADPLSAEESGEGAAPGALPTSLAGSAAYRTLAALPLQIGRVSGAHLMNEGASSQAEWDWENGNRLTIRKETRDGIEGKFLFSVRAWMERRENGTILPQAQGYTRPFYAPKWLEYISYREEVLPIDTDARGSVTVVLEKDGRAYEGVTVRLYRIADIDWDGTVRASAIGYGWGDTYERYGESTLRGIVAGMNADVAAEGYTDAGGTVVFEDLPVGVYYVLPLSPYEEWNSEEYRAYFHRFSDAMVVLPQENASHDGFDLDLTVRPGVSVEADQGENISRTIRVVLNDEGTGYEDRRPYNGFYAELYAGSGSGWSSFGSVWIDESSGWTAAVDNLDPWYDYFWYMEVPWTDGGEVPYRAEWAYSADGSETIVTLTPQAEPSFVLPEGVTEELIFDYLDLSEQDFRHPWEFYYSGEYREIPWDEGDNRYFFELSAPGTDSVEISALPNGAKYEIEEWRMPDYASVISPASGVIRGQMRDEDKEEVFVNGRSGQQVTVTKHWDDYSDAFGLRPATHEDQTDWGVVMYAFTTSRVRARYTITEQDIEAAWDTYERLSDYSFRLYVPLPDDVEQAIADANIVRTYSGSDWVSEYRFPVRIFIDETEVPLNEGRSEEEGVGIYEGGNFYCSLDFSLIDGKYALCLYGNPNTWAHDFETLIGQEIRVVREADVEEYSTKYSHGQARPAVVQDDANDVWTYTYTIGNDEEILYIEERPRANNYSYSSESHTYLQAEKQSQNVYEMTNTLATRTVRVAMYTLNNDNETTFDYEVDLWYFNKEGEQVPYVIPADKLNTGVSMPYDGHYTLSLTGNGSYRSLYKGSWGIPVSVYVSAVQLPKEGWDVYAACETDGQLRWDDTGILTTFINEPNLFAIRKIWDDGGNAAGLRPEDIEWELVRHEPREDGEAYAVYDRTYHVLTFFRDEPGKYTNKQRIGDKVYYTGVENTGTTFESVPWADDFYNTSGVRRIVIRDIIRPVNTAFWFAHLGWVARIEGLNNLDTSRVTSMRYMFGNYYSVGGQTFHQYVSEFRVLDLSSFDTSSVTDMTAMFSYCPHLTTIYVGDGWDTSNVEAGRGMFSSAGVLPNFDGVLDVTRAHTGEGGYLTYKADPETFPEVERRGVEKDGDVWTYRYYAPYRADILEVRESGVPALYTSSEPVWDDGERVWSVTNSLPKHTLTVSKSTDAQTEDTFDFRIRIGKTVESATRRIDFTDFDVYYYLDPILSGRDIESYDFAWPLSGEAVRVYRDDTASYGMLNDGGNVTKLTGAGAELKFREVKELYDGGVDISRMSGRLLNPAAFGAMIDSIYEGIESTVGSSGTRDYIGIKLDPASESVIVRVPIGGLLGNSAEDYFVYNVEKGTERLRRDFLDGAGLDTTGVPGIYAFALGSGEERTFPDIPYGYEYEVWEVDASGNRVWPGGSVNGSWGLVSESGTAGTMTGDRAAAFRNAQVRPLSLTAEKTTDVPTGDRFDFRIRITQETMDYDWYLPENWERWHDPNACQSISSKVTGVDNSMEILHAPGQNFLFTVTLTRPAGSEAEKVHGYFYNSLDGANFEPDGDGVLFDFSGGDAATRTFTMKNDQKLVFAEDLTGFTCSVQIDNSVLTSPYETYFSYADEGPVEAGSFTCVFETDGGTLMVNNSGNSGTTPTGGYGSLDPLPALAYEDIAELGHAPLGPMVTSYLAPGGSDVTATAQEGVYAFSLHSGIPLTIPGLPYGCSCEVWEVNASGERLAVGDAVNDSWVLALQTGASGVMTQDRTAAFLNEIRRGALTVSKTVTGGGDEDKAFEFVVRAWRDVDIPENLEKIADVDVTPAELAEKYCIFPEGVSFRGEVLEPSEQ
ncbi:MAG: BspA family leucine-rich repeat surface protein, partial [Lachnospiraceae bacterium]|nr:BspA family leucine-rich repeat surface protein [Lachnospiraceae bacterium]